MFPFHSFSEIEICFPLLVAGMLKGCSGNIRSALSESHLVLGIRGFRLD
jgi:hypothetical protein